MEGIIYVFNRDTKRCWMCPAHPRLTRHRDGLLNESAMQGSIELLARMHAGLKQLGACAIILCETSHDAKVSTLNYLTR